MNYRLFIVGARQILHRRRLLAAILAFFFAVCFLWTWRHLSKGECPLGHVTSSSQIPRPPAPQWEEPPGSPSPLCQVGDYTGWRPLVLSPHSLHFYSAFYDPLGANGPTLRILGLAPLAQKEGLLPLVCRIEASMTYSNSSSVKAIPASLQIIPEHHGNEYTGVYLFCTLPEKAQPRYVAIAETDKSPVLVRLAVIYPDRAPERSRNITVCLPMLFDFFEAHRLVERLELARLMGAERVVTYCHSVTSGVRRVMDLYVTQGFLKVLPWNVPPVHVHYFAQMVAINDCLYRNFLSSKYVMFQDIDEVIVPTRGRNWKQLIQDLNFDKSNASALQFRMSYFHGQGTGELSLEERGRVSWLGLSSLQTTYREEYVFPHDVRAKTLVVPARVETMGIHWPHKLRPGATELVRVSDGEALVHHYRDGGSAPTFHDPSLLHLAPALIANAQRAWDALTVRWTEFNRTMNEGEFKHNVH